MAAGSGKVVNTRPNVKGQSFKNHKLDVAYPVTGDLLLMVETKATGVPKHPRSTRQKNPEGRRGSADLDKRVKEASFKNIDIKAEAARLAGVGGGPTSDLVGWLRAAPPRSFIFLAVRVIDDNDYKNAEKLALIAGQWFEGCGLFCYRKNTQGTGYEAAPIRNPNLELGVVLDDAINALAGM